MSRQQLNVRVTQRTIDQVNTLVGRGYETQSNVVMAAVSNLYQQEHTMSQQTITIGSIDTVPQADPFAQNQLPTRTAINLDPATRTVEVEQEQRTGSTLSTYYHGIKLSFAVDGHPLEDRMRDWLEKQMPLLERIVAGHSVDWDGHNHVGKLTPDAKEAEQEMHRQCDLLSEGCSIDYVEQWHYWDEHDWLDPIEVEATTTDAEIATMADDAMMAAKDDHVVFGFDSNEEARERIVEIITNERDELREEAEQQA